MMNMVEEAIIYATIMHQGSRRKTKNIPTILHPLEVAQILATITEDEEIITAGILHDVVEDTDGTLEEIEKRFGFRVAFLVDSETEQKFPGENREKSWRKRKELSLKKLKESNDIGVEMLWLSDKLANIRSLAGDFSERGNDVWQSFHQKDPNEHKWYYSKVAEYTELNLNKTGAYKELIKHINYIWPDTFDSGKTRYKKYKEVSVEGCPLLGRGYKGDVYKYNDELLIKVYNNNNTYLNVQQELESSRRAFVLGAPTAISFGIVSVGNRYGAMYELFDADTLTQKLKKDPANVDYYALVMANLAHQIHDIQIDDEDIFPKAKTRFANYIENGVAKSDAGLARELFKLLDGLNGNRNMIHGDFHTSNVFLQMGEPMVIDMDRISVGSPILELGDMYLYYVGCEEREPLDIDPYLDIPYGICKSFYDAFIIHYMDTSDKDVISLVNKKARLISNIRLFNRIWKKENLSSGAKALEKKLIMDTTELVSSITDLNL